MVSGTDYIRLHNPNIPVYTNFQQSSIQPGQFISSFGDGECPVDKSVATVEAFDMYIPNFSVRATKGEFHRNAVLINESGEGKDLLGSCLFLEGTMRSTLPKNPDYVDSYNRSQNFKFDPDNEYLHVLPKDHPLHLLHFSYTAEYFLQFLPENERWADSLKNKIVKKERILGDRVTPITLPQERALQYITDCPLTGKLGLVMMETSIIQIILMQLNALFNQQKNSLIAGVSKRELETIHELKEYITKRFLEDHSLPCLAKVAGMNTNKLMVLFKKIFGQSIFEYISHLRMDHAKELLYEGDLMITEIARTVGYKNPNHFSSAFKKRFGFNPSVVKSNTRLVA